MNDFASASDVDKRRAGGALPPLAGEDHVCADCGISYLDVAVEQARARIADLPADVRSAVASLPAAVLRVRPAPDVWSVIEYLCHLRDVQVASTIRLYRTRTEEEPVLEPMLNDLRAKRFRYRDADPAAVGGEFAAAVAGCLDEIDRVGADGWDRTATRLPGEQRTARWLVRQAMHEGVHHLADIRRVAAAVADLPDQSGG